TLKTKGALTVSLAQSVGNHNLTMNTDGNFAINQSLTGTGIFTLQQISDNKSLVIGDTGGDDNITSTELGRITDGWSKLIFGKASATGNLTVSNVIFNDPVELHNAGLLTIGGPVNMQANDLTVLYNDINIAGALTGTGNLAFRHSLQNNYVFGASGEL